MKGRERRNRNSYVTGTNGKNEGKSTGEADIKGSTYLQKTYISEKELELKRKSVSK